jgi:hypothetical protein
MPTAGPLKPNNKAIQAYYDALKTFAAQHVEREGAFETAFSRLLADTARPHGWTLIPKMSLKVGSKTIAPDGTLRDEFYLRHGYWEAKDTHDDLDAEIRAKIRKGYPLGKKPRVFISLPLTTEHLDSKLGSLMTPEARNQNGPKFRAS